MEYDAAMRVHFYPRSRELTVPSGERKTLTLRMGPFGPRLDWPDVYQGLSDLGWMAKTEWVRSEVGEFYWCYGIRKV